VKAERRELVWTGDWKLGTEDWRMGIGNRGLETGEWRMGMGS